MVKESPSLESDISTYVGMTKFRRPLIQTIIDSLGLPKGSIGLDAGCGIGMISRLLARAIGKEGYVTGMDISEQYLDYARKQEGDENVKFIEGDVNSLPFEEESFDWIWSMDTVWPGPKEMGCPSETPYPIIENYHRVLRPGGRIFILFWTHQQILPGYPLLEARLNTASSITELWSDGMDPMIHGMNAGNWLERMGFTNISSRTFLADINAPFNDNDILAMNILFPMLWGEAEARVDREDWDLFQRITDPDSPDYLLKNPHYHGFYSYSLFTGKKV